MPNLVTIAEMKALEAAADRAGVSVATLMENAGRAVAEAVLARVEDPAQQRAVVLCGPGNNGGDGMVAAHYLANAGMTVAVYFTRLPAESDPNLQRLRARALFIADAENDQRWRVLKNLLGGATVLIDAIFGTGARLPIAGIPREVLTQVQAVLRERARLFIVAVDCPSGMNCDTGELDSAAIPADLTVTFAAAKRGHFAFPAAEALGELVVADIGIPASLPENQIRLQLASPAEVRALLPPRPRNAHKGTFGRALIAAGSVNYTGAAYLAAAAAYRIGAGLVTLAVPQPIYPILAAQLPEATWLVLPSDTGVIAAGAAEVLRKELGKASALLIGPGLGAERTTSAFLKRILQGEETSPRKAPMGFATRVSASADSSSASALPPLVIDADGLRLLAQIENWPGALPANSVLTPHPGEMSALTGLSRDELQSDRIAAAQKFAAEWGQVVVLKGAFSVIAAPDGRATVLPFATSALARAGTGDVLAGAIVGLMAQGVLPYEAAVAGAYIHARAGELAARALGTTASVMASDVLEGLAEALADLA